MLIPSSVKMASGKPAGQSCRVSVRRNFLSPLNLGRWMSVDVRFSGVVMRHENRLKYKRLKPRRSTAAHCRFSGEDTSGPPASAFCIIAPLTRGVRMDRFLWSRPSLVGLARNVINCSEEYDQVIISRLSNGWENGG